MSYVSFSDDLLPTDYVPSQSAPPTPEYTPPSGGDAQAIPDIPNCAADEFSLDGVCTKLCPPESNSIWDAASAACRCRPGYVADSTKKGCKLAPASAPITTPQYISPIAKPGAVVTKKSVLATMAPWLIGGAIGAAALGLLALVGKTK
jgi:hypothetical protein